MNLRFLESAAKIRAAEAPRNCCVCSCMGSAPARSNYSRGSESHVTSAIAHSEASVYNIMRFGELRV